MRLADKLQRKNQLNISLTMVSGAKQLCHQCVEPALAPTDKFAATLPIGNRTIT